MRILLAEDERSLSRAVSALLEKNNYSVDAVYDGQEALDFLDGGNYDALILDIMMPKLDGLEVLRRLRQQGNPIPVLMLTAKSEVEDKVTGLDMGANDYLTKPFSTAELMARIRAALRHSNRLDSDTELYKRPYVCGDLTVDFDKRLVFLNGESIHLTQIEYRLVSLLARNAGRVLTYDNILTQIWGPYIERNNQILRVNMANVRRKLEKNPADPQYIFTEVGIGYRMAEETPRAKEEK